MISILYRKMSYLSNMDEKIFVANISYFLKQYDNWRFLCNENLMFVLEGDKYRKLTRKEKMKFLMGET